MADILLRGFEMPTDASLWLLIRPDGTVHKLKVGGKHGEPQQGVAVPIPDGHGDLIDRDALKKRTPMVIDYSAGGFGTDGSIRPVRGYGDWQIDQAPTIVPAEGGTDNADHAD